MKDKGLSIKVAIAQEFFKGLASLSPKAQGKVQTMIANFTNDPTSPGLNYETISGAADPNLHSIRVDQKYRAIVLKPDSGNVYLLLWVDNHDEAYEWARRKRPKIHPDTGALQIVPVLDLPQQQGAEADEGQSSKGLFATFKDRELRRIGIPDDFIPLVRSIQSESELDQQVSEIPDEAQEALYMLASGYSLEEVVREQMPVEPVAVDTTDFKAALENPDTLRRFYVVDDAVELQEILNSPLERWRVFLHPSQRKLVEWDVNGPIRVLGGAGTGKTVVAMHRARWLSRQLGWATDQRILVTTFTRNLAADIQENLRNLCSGDELRRIEVINLDAWVRQFLNSQGYDCRLDYQVAGEQLKTMWSNALNLAPQDMGFPEQFYLDEWAEVIQANGVSSFDEYLRVPRTGRGRRLNRLQRKKIWPVFEEYRAQLNRENIREKEDAFRDARKILERKGDILNYRSVIVDEAQDFSAEAFRLIRQIVPPNRKDITNDLFIVGDAHQRIYGRRIVLGQCGIDIRGRGRRLKVNYRTTEETKAWAVALLEGRQIDDLDGGKDTSSGYRSLMHGPKPIVKVCKSWGEEVDYMHQLLKEIQKEDVPEYNICIVARTHSALDGYVDSLKQRGHSFHEVTSRDQRTRPGIRCGTMHRVKGIEFDYIIAAGVDDGLVPLNSALADLDNPFAEEEAENRERALLYVSVTRARKVAFITSSGNPSRFLKSSKD